jgi:hypothetical protein
VIHPAASPEAAREEPSVLAVLASALLGIVADCAMAFGTRTPSSRLQATVVAMHSLAMHLCH